MENDRNLAPMMDLTNTQLKQIRHYKKSDIDHYDTLYDDTQHNRKN